MKMGPHKGSATARAVSAVAVAARMNDPSLPQRRQELAVAKVEDRIKELVEDWPLTTEQRGRLREILAGPSEVDG